MHQIRFRPGLPRHPSWFKGALLLSAGKRRGRERKGREEEEKGTGGEGDGREGEKGRKVETPPPSIPAYAPIRIATVIASAGTLLQTQLFSNFVV